MKRDEPDAKHDNLRDPVCGQEVDPLRARAVGIWGDRTFYFCCTAHKAEFARDPARYLRSEPAVPAPAPPAPPAPREPSGRIEPPAPREPSGRIEPPLPREAERRERAPALRPSSDLGSGVLSMPVSPEGAASALLSSGRQRLWVYLAAVTVVAAIGLIALLATRA